MLDELGEHCRVGDVVSTFDAGGAALFAAPSGGAFAGGTNKQNNNLFIKPELDALTAEINQIKAQIK